MPIAPHEANSLPGKIRRQRLTTACGPCRDRRVKCNRLKPACSQCTKASRPCKYVSGNNKKLEFRHVTSPDSEAPSDGSWTSLLDQQTSLSRTPSCTGIPSWVLAEEKELSFPRPKRCMPPAHGVPISSLDEEFLHFMTSRMPSSILCQRYFENFLRTIYPLVPICHVPTLEQTYSSFYSTLCSDISAELLLLVLAILSAGSANMPSPDSSSPLLLDLYNEIASHLDLASYHIRDEDAALQLLQAHLIMNTFRANQLAPFAAYGFLPQAIRFGQLMRLHLEQSEARNCKSSRSPECVEQRRRVWFHLVFLDVESVVANGLPPIIRSDGYITKLPSLTYDCEPLSEPKQQVFENMSSTMIATQGHYLWAKHMQKWFEVLPTQAEVADFRAVINHLLEVVPDNGCPEEQWTRTYLKMQIDRAYCMLGLRFWQLDRFSGTGCQSEVVRTARSFLHHYLTLSASSNSHFSWFLPGLVQPLHAMIILLMHLSSCTHIYSEESLSRSLLDDVFELRISRIRAGSIISEKAKIKGEMLPQRSNKRYSMLVDLRMRVWKRLGWDRNGRGKDPFCGRLDDEDGQRAETSGEEGINDVAKGGQEDSTDSMNSYMVGIEDLMAEDPMDMFHWDKWEGLTEGLFVS
ncbi:uncharacterized protein LY89DRAFT_262461 [Mollisia scopiformis]|uniref:Zn(2)-C6 fungal-type domain-containing protein n=1 Tax=Mollisia scopiformis TaxID=149040 RepID=A0A132BDK7_MOLSC|nr:uncharacterized protein LY89DRAFT_262461 [Mollisia scopiformis]KUJ10476.1 hypothetical protein LY89DRAFT_262461 [Mollisia scopiformis]